MTEGFSGIVRITNASDYIAPSQACILPLRKTGSVNENESKVLIRKKDFNNDSLAEKKRVTVSLNDCLACNGCVTSAESILVQEQSTSKFTEGLSAGNISVVTVSPQSLSSIAVKRGFSLQNTARLLSMKLKSLGAHYVVDSSFARYFSLSASYEEFKAKRDQKCLITSICPGFVCYAEKVQGETLLPLLSHVRSPQAIMGSLVKDFLSRKLSVEPKKIFHAAIMPCFDKKLEASRPDFNADFSQVDCVISTSEADSLLDCQSFPTSANIDTKEGCFDWLTSLEAGIVIGTPGGSSGGYAEYIVQQFILENKLDARNIRTYTKQKDLEVIEVVNNETVLLTASRCYGFRNIQSLVQKLKRKKCLYNYVEVMACPSGCTNGGGQIRGETIEARAEMLNSVQREFNALQPVPEMEKCVEKVKLNWRKLNEDWEKWLFTDFHMVDRNILQRQQITW